MKLYEHPDFEQAILQAAEHFRNRGLRPAIIEKDYSVTETLRLVAKTKGVQVIFKGGTSLSKGWNLIQRFSEDVDLCLDPLAFKPVQGKRGIDQELKKVRDAVAMHPGLFLEGNESQTVGGFGARSSECLTISKRKQRWAQGHFAAAGCKIPGSG